MNFNLWIYIKLVLLSSIVLGQRIQKESPKELYSEIITLEDKGLTNIIDSLSLKESHCKRNGQYWYLEHIKENYFLFSKGRLSLLIATLKENEKIYLTLVNGRLIFIISKIDSILSIKKKGFKVSLDNFRRPNAYFEDSSNWILKEVEGEFEVVKEQIFSCE